MPKEIAWKLKLNTLIDMKDVTSKQKKLIVEEVGEFLVDSILEDVSKLKSPVAGGSFKKTLNKEYKKFKEKSGLRGVPNLEFEGDMLDSLTYKPFKEGLKIGVFDKDQVAKTDGHNNHSGKSKLPPRQFIPKPKQKFKASIMRDAKKIAEEIVEETS